MLGTLAGTLEIEERRLILRRFLVVCLLAAAALTAAGCGGDDTATRARAARSAATARAPSARSSRLPPSRSATRPAANVTVGISGTGGGFERFCRGETDLSNASRPIDEDEVAICEENGVEYLELQVANDALTVVVNPENDWATCLTVDELNAIWKPGSTVSSWRDVRASFPDEPLELFGPGTDSGTFDYFTARSTARKGQAAPTTRHRRTTT